MDNEHNLKLSAAELDAALARAQNALPRDGSAEMYGSLRMRLDDVATGEFSCFGGGTWMRLVLNSQDYHSIVLMKNLAQLRFYDNGEYSENTILHTGNKPSGSYTGNGSAEARPIDVGGVGNVIVLFSCYGVVFVTGGVAHIIRNDGSVLQLTNVSYGAGVLNLSTDDPAINLNSVEYNYQVL